MVLKRNTSFFLLHKIKQNFLQDFEYSFDLNNDKVKKVDNWKVLGMIFQENLSWEKHIDQLIVLVTRNCLY